MTTSASFECENAWLVKRATVDGHVLIQINDVSGAQVMAIVEEQWRLWLIGQGDLCAYVFDCSSSPTCKQGFLS